jgi:hypothetical protein
MARRKREARLYAKCPGHPRLGANKKKDVDTRDIWREDALRAFARA